MNIDLVVECSECGSYLEVSETYRRGEILVSVEPCSKCKEDAEEDGYKQGYDEGHQEGYNEGIDED